MQKFSQVISYVAQLIMAMISELHIHGNSCHDLYTYPERLFSSVTKSNIEM